MMAFDKLPINNKIPQYFAQKCPVCNGWGTVSFKRISCHACLGKGYILIPIDREKNYEINKRNT